jgi:alanyl-tRNA synthetase
VTPEEIQQIEALVNQKIREDIRRDEAVDIPISQAQEAGARMLFGEKYGDKVRMITFDPTFSVELCGGCHVPSTGRIGFFKITSESAVAAGVRRIEAVTADAAEKFINAQLDQLHHIRQELKNPPDAVKAIRELQQEIKSLRQQVEEAELQRAGHIKQQLLSQVEDVNGIKLIAAEVNLQDPKLLKNLIYQLGHELGDQTFILLGTREESKASLVLYISEALVKSKKWHAGQIIKQLAVHIEGGGGGQPFFASAGGTSPKGLATALSEVRTYIES